MAIMPETKNQIIMLKPYDLLELTINDSKFNLTGEFELVREFDQLNEDKIGNDVLKDCEVVIGESYNSTSVNGMLVKKLRTYDGMDAIKDTKICDQKADAVYALTNMSGEVYYFLTWFVAK